MPRTRRISRLELLATPVLLAASLFAHAQEVEVKTEFVPTAIGEPGVAFHLDNDLFTAAGDDSDYSWGATLTIWIARTRAPGCATGPGATEHCVIAARS